MEPVDVHLVQQPEQLGGLLLDPLHARLFEFLLSAARVCYNHLSFK